MADEAGWMPIETAPKGEADMLLLFEPHSDVGFQFVGRWDEMKREWFNNLDFKTQHPTYWRPLPPAPEAPHA